MNDMRKLMEATTLLEYLIREGDNIKSLLGLNLFGDTGQEEDAGIVYGPDDVSWEEGELDPELQQEWVREVKPYAQRAKKLKRQIMRHAEQGRKLTNVEADAAEGVWYDGSDLYGELEFAFEELPKIWDQQIEVVTDIINGDIVDEYEESVDEAYDDEVDGPAPSGNAEGVLRDLLRELQQLERNTSRVYREVTLSKSREDFGEMAANELGMTLTEITDIVEKYEDFI